MPGICKKAPLVFIEEEFLAVFASSTIFTTRECGPQTRTQKLQKVIVQKEN